MSEGSIPVDGASLHYRDVGQGLPIVVVHGRPDFDHRYLLPDLDRLADSFRLIYYDQRGRGRSADGVRPEDVSVESEVADLERVRAFLQLETVAVLGHSWGGLLALEHAIRHPDRVAHLILMNTAPASRDGYLVLRDELSKKRAPGDAESMKEIAARAEYAAGDPDTVEEFNRIHFRASVCDPENLERVIDGLRPTFTPEAILKARAIEDRLRDQTWLSPDYDLLPSLHALPIRTLIIHGDHEFIPLECVAPIARALPDARLVVLADCGHFSYLERPDEVHAEVSAFLGGA